MGRPPCGHGETQTAKGLGQGDSNQIRDFNTEVLSDIKSYRGYGPQEIVERRSKQTA